MGATLPRPRCHGVMNLPRAPQRGQAVRCPQCGAHFPLGKTVAPPATPAKAPFLNRTTSIAVGATIGAVLLLNLIGFFVIKAWSGAEPAPDVQAREKEPLPAPRSPVVEKPA